MGDDDSALDDPTARLAFAAAGAALIALATLSVEIWTARFSARIIGFERGFLSMPLGATALVLAALTARTNWRYAAPAVLLGLVYWLAVVVYWWGG